MKQFYKQKMMVFFSIHFIFSFFLLLKEHFPAVSLGINAFSSIQTVNMMPGAPNQTVPSLTLAAEALALLPPGQVSHPKETCTPRTSASNQKLRCFHTKCVHSCTADLGQNHLPLLPRLQEPGLCVLSSQGKNPEHTLIVFVALSSCSERHLSASILLIPPVVSSNSRVALRHSANVQAAPSTTQPRPCLRDTP